MTTSLFPLFLDLRDRPALVVGAGSVGTRKIRDLVEHGARVRVVAPEAHEEVKALAGAGQIAWEARPFRAEDCEGAWLAIAATADPEVQAAVLRAANERRIFLIAVDDTANATAYSGAILRRPPLTVAISSNGEAPALVRLLRELFEEALPAADWVDAARALRAKWRAEGTPMGSRFAELVRAFKERAG